MKPGLNARGDSGVGRKRWAQYGWVRAIGVRKNNQFFRLWKRKYRGGPWVTGGFFLPWSLLFLTSSEFKEKYQHLRIEMQTPIAAAETTSGATMAFSGDLKFPWLRNSLCYLSSKGVPSMYTEYSFNILSYIGYWRELPLISVIVISLKGCTTGVCFDQSLDIFLFPSPYPKWRLALVPKILKHEGFM